MVFRSVLASMNVSSFSGLGLGVLLVVNSYFQILFITFLRFVNGCFRSHSRFTAVVALNVQF